MTWMICPKCLLAGDYSASAVKTCSECGRALVKCPLFPQIDALPVQSSSNAANTERP